ncbi:Triacylglycerol lipase protein [Dioscorea alata]|uniref:Triacylglycerol lipase protein n=1 Tax=Dioscorea alata TaxID=55571 RepID=A0ACB7WUF3_DIOAL|nr:Triacylglycerol lipase protein [Dioscorea alata]
MATNSTFMFKWLICCALVINVGLSAREDDESTEGNITSMSSPFQSPTLPDAPYICKLRAKIFGYKCEEHEVTTKDGYILSIQRIPQGLSSSKIEGEKREPVLLMHGLLMDGAIWLINHPNESLGFILADKGYDVWIANTRGTWSSRRHTFLSTSHPDYWEWSWDELVSFDLPAIFNYIYTNTSQQKFHYVGHSLGSLTAFALFSQNNLPAKMVRSAVMLCPIAYMNLDRSILVQLAAAIFTAEAHYWLGVKEFIPTGKNVLKFLKKTCNEPGVDCSNILTSLTGKNCCLKISSIHVFTKFEPQSTSTKLMVHLSQMIRRGTVAKYDYNNMKKNMDHYGQPTPPPYNLSAIPLDLPLFLINGGMDLLADVGDLYQLLFDLGFHKSDRLKLHFQSNYSHVDFIMGFNAKEEIYDHVVEFMSLQ